jgi:hypothetical protein
MITVRHIEKLWTARKYEPLLRDMLAGRPEASTRLELELSGYLPAAAMALIRLDELAQAHVPLYPKLLTAVCLRALMGSRGQGIAIERGLFYLAQMQKEEGIWPKVPFRRMPADPFVSAFVLLQLGSDDGFRQAVRFVDALNWFESHESTLDAETRRLWDHASIRCQMVRNTTPVWHAVVSWS